MASTGWIHPRGASTFDLNNANFLDNQGGDISSDSTAAVSQTATGESDAITINTWNGNWSQLSGAPTGATSSFPEKSVIVGVEYQFKAGWFFTNTLVRWQPGFETSSGAYMGTSVIQPLDVNAGASSTVHTFGSSTSTFGLDWGRFQREGGNNILNHFVIATFSKTAGASSGTAVTFAYMARAKFYYEPAPPPFRLKNSHMTLKRNKLNIK